MKTLIVHVGPPKTATTSLQQFLLAHRAALSLQGINYAVDYEGAAGCHRLAERLLTLDGSGNIGEEWFSWDSAAGAFGDIQFPATTDDETQLMSAEAFHALGRNGVAALVEWASAECVTVIAGIRDPERWIWSLWQQSVKDGRTSVWSDDVRAWTSSRVLFASSSLGGWRGFPTVNVEIIDLDALSTPSVLGDFASAAGLPSLLEVGGPPSRVSLGQLNESMDPEETLLTSVFSGLVASGVNDLMWSWFGDVPEAFVRRGCLDLADHGRPAFEWSRRIRKDEVVTSQLFDQGAADCVAQYCLAWAADAEGTAADVGLPMSSTARHRLRAAATRARERASLGALRQPSDHGYPADDVASRVPLDAQTLASPRVAAALLCQAWRMRSLWVTR